MSIATQQVTVAQVEKVLVAASPHGQQVAIHNTGATSVFVGAPGVTATGAGGGTEVPAGQWVPPSGMLDLPPEDEVHAIATAGSNRVDVFQVVAD